MFGLDRLELDRDFLARDDVYAEVDVTCAYEKRRGKGKKGSQLKPSH